MGLKTFSFWTTGSQEIPRSNNILFLAPRLLAFVHGKDMYGLPVQGPCQERGLGLDSDRFLCGAGSEDDGADWRKAFRYSIHSEACAAFTFLKSMSVRQMVA
jgi:hypothetical protein